MIGVAKDLDVPPELEELDIEKVWKCINLNKNAPCTSILGDLIIFNETNYQYLPPNIFEPYNTYMFTFICTKGIK